MISYPCPYCSVAADAVAGCPGCGRGPDQDAVEVVRLDGQIRVLTQRLAATDAELRETWRLRHAAAARVRAAVASARPATVAAPARPAPAVPGRAVSAGAAVSGAAVSGAAVPEAAVPGAVAPGKPEASGKLVQNALFLLGGLLLGVAAIVFTAVAWAQFGVGGRAALLAAFTAAALAAPLAALRRGLSATAETFAGVGLLLVLLDGYAAWYVDLFGVARYSALAYAGAVFAVTAAVAAGYEHVTGLVGPRFVALLCAQPVLPLLVAPLHPGAAGWAFTLAGTAVLNLAVVYLRGARTALVMTAYALGAALLAASALAALVALAVAGAVPAAAVGGAALVTAAAVAVAGAGVSGSAPARSVTGFLAVVALGVGAARVAALAVPQAALVAVAAVAALLAVGVTVVLRHLPSEVRPGPWAGAATVVLVPFLYAGERAIVAAAGTWSLARPVFDAPAAVAGGDRWLAAVLVLLTAGAVVLLPRGARGLAVVVGAVPVAFAAPAALHLPWWSAAGFDLLAAAGVLAFALRARRSGGGAHVAARTTEALRTAARGLVRPGVALVAVVPVVHALGVGFGRPGVAALTLTGVLALGIGTAAAARGRRDIGGIGLAVGLLAVPAIGWTGAAAAGLPTSTQSRAALAGVALLVAVRHLVAVRWPGYGGHALAAALLGAVSAPLWTAVSGDPAGVYAASGLLLVALATGHRPQHGRRGHGRNWAAAAAVPLGVVLLGAVATGLVSVLVLPWGWLADVWSGRPAGVGLHPDGLGRVAAAAVLAVALLAPAAALAAGRRAAHWVAAAPLALTGPLALAAAGVSWPAVPAASLLAGLAGLLAVAIRPPWRPGTGGFGATGAAARRAGASWPAASGVATAVTCALLAAAGLAGALPTRWTTLVGLGGVLVVGAVVGAAGRDLPARLAGWLGAAGAALGFAYTAGRAAGLPVAHTALPVLGVAALALAVGTLLAGRRPVEGRAVQAAAHAGAVVALLLSAGTRYAAVVCALWGVALGVRALRSGTANRRIHIVAAAGAELLGWWLLLDAQRVSLVEAYTLPAAGVALLAGWLARRTRAELSSWSAYAVALGAALLPTLAVVLANEGEPVRRLLLGLGALAVVLLGARARLQAPVVTGGAVLGVVALHEAALIWDLLPRWIPLAAAGLLLVGLAMTLERRRRDLARLRAALNSMA